VISGGGPFLGALALGLVFRTSPPSEA
jgi:hypothetical protein